MATNLKAAAQALKQLQPKKQFAVQFRSSSIYSIVVEAHDQEEAETLAWEGYNEGNANCDDQDTDLTDITQID